jgi:hypothetical protein
MLDALLPFVEELQRRVDDGARWQDAWRAAADVATEAARATAELRPKVGRARPLAERSVGTPDAGATSLAMCARTVADCVAHRQRNSWCQGALSFGVPAWTALTTVSEGRKTRGAQLTVMIGWSDQRSVAPGLIDTDITGGALEGERKTQLIAGIPVGRNGNVNDVADLITYLCREESGYITGATYDVNGGSHIHWLMRPGPDGSLHGSDLQRSSQLYRGGPTSFLLSCTRRIGKECSKLLRFNPVTVQRC